ncbi:MAG TPA: YfhO family protein [Bryobacteraceae bacterium]|nr:YfhO family protein [Bryobacteraceae bacterium]
MPEIKSPPEPDSTLERFHNWFQKSARLDRKSAGKLGLLCTLAFFIEYLPPFQHVQLWSDIAGYHYPLQVYALRTLKEGRFPLWDPSIYSGISFAGNIQAALLYPPNWLMYLSGAPWFQLPFKMLELFTFLHVWAAFWLCYLWLRERADKMSAVLGAGVFAFSGYMMWETLHTGVLCTVTWIPLALWGIDQAVERRDWRPLWKVAAGSALSLLAGYPAAWMVVCAVILTYALGSREHWRAFIGAAIAIGVSCGLGAVALLPALDAHSMMMIEPKYGPGAWGFGTILLSSLVPNWWDFNPGHPGTYEPGCVYLYLGLPTVFAVLWAMWQRQWRRFVQPVLVLLVALMLAHPARILLAAVARIPALENTMSPFQFLAGIAPMGALITALSVHSFLKAKAKLAVPQWAAPVVAIALAGWSVRQLAIWIQGGKFAIHAAAIVFTAIAVGLFALGLVAFRSSLGWRRSVLGAAILLLVWTDFKVYGSGRWFNAVTGDEDAKYVNTGMPGVDQATFNLLSSTPFYRIACDEDASPYSTDLRIWELTTPQGFDPFLPIQYRDAVEKWVKFRTNRIFYMDVENGRMLQAFGVGYVITHEGAGKEPFLAKSPDFALVGKGDTFYRIYRYVQAKPTYRWADDAMGSTQVVSWTPERRDLLVTSATGGRFALLEQFFPGWKAKVDGKAVATERWNGAFQSIMVPAGQHRVVFSFAPRSLWVGGLLSLLALAALVPVVIAEVRRGRAMRNPPV